MNVQIAETADQIRASFPVMHELRSHLNGRCFVDRIRSQQAQGYQLVYLSCRNVPVAGFGIGENLAWGRFLYVDDLVTTARACSHGTALSYSDGSGNSPSRTIATHSTWTRVPSGRMITGSTSVKVCACRATTFTGGSGEVVLTHGDKAGRR